MVEDVRHPQTTTRPVSAQNPQLRPLPADFPVALGLPAPELNIADGTLSLNGETYQAARVSADATPPSAD